MVASGGQWRRNIGRDMTSLRAAARACMEDACERHRPAECDCEVQRVTPIEFVAWIENELRLYGLPPVRFENGHRPTKRGVASVRGIGPG